MDTCEAARSLTVGGVISGGLCREIPGQQFGDAIDRVVSDARQHLAQIGFRIKAIELGRSDQAVNRCRTFAASIRSRKKVILPAQSHGAQGAFGGVVIYLQATVVAVTHQGIPERERILHRRRGIGLPRQLGQRCFQPGVQRLQQGPSAGLAYLLSLLRRTAADLTFDRVQLGDVSVRSWPSGRACDSCAFC